MRVAWLLVTDGLTVPGCLPACEAVGMEEVAQGQAEQGAQWPLA